MDTSLLLFVGAVVTLLVVLYALERSRDAGARQRIDEAEEIGTHIPVSLHPRIDPDICIGSAACALACPEGTILEIVGGRGYLAHAAECVGHGRCQAACPVNAIDLVFGHEKRGVDIPMVSGTFETNRPGIYIAGELGGMGLVRNAVRQGHEVVEYIAADLAAAGQKRGDGFDLLVVGAGPAGIAAVARARQLGLSVCLLDQGKPGGTVLQYPRQKIVMTAPFSLVGVGTVDRSELSKPELMAILKQALEKADPCIELGILRDLSGSRGYFMAEKEGSTEIVCRAARVLLALGRRGTPARLGISGESLPQVTYKLSDEWQYGGRRVVVVGGGDSAVETCLTLAAAGAHPALVYRGETLNRVKHKNRELLARAIDSGAVAVHWNTELCQIDSGTVTCKNGQQLPADYVVIQIGGTPPVQLLERLGIVVQTHFG